MSSDIGRSGSMWLELVGTGIKETFRDVGGIRTRVLEAGDGPPLLLLHGRQDMTYPAALVEPTLALILNARGVVLEEAGHMAHVDQPEAWLTAISDFLDEAGP